MEKGKNTLVWVVVAVVFLLILFGSFGMGGYGMMGFGFIFMLLFWGLIIWLIITLINNAGQSNKDEPDLLTILKRRYASGKITKKRYEEMRKELNR